MRVLACAVLVVLLAGCGRLGGEPFVGELNAPIPLAADEAVVQTINPVEDRLTAIDLPFATYGEAPDPTGAVEVVVRSAADGEVLGTTDIDAESIGEGRWAAAAFDPALDVPDVVAVELTWSGVTPLAVWGNVTLDGTEGIVNDPYAEGELAAGAPTGVEGGDLAFRVRTPDGVGDAVGQVTASVRTGGARVLDDPPFAVGWGLAVLGAAALAVWGLRRREG